MPLKWTSDKIIKFIEDEGYVFIKHISGIGKSSRILIWCGNPEHKPYEVIFDNFRRGSRCKQCYNDKSIKWNENNIKKYLLKEGYILISILNGRGVNSLIKIKCIKCGYEYKIPFDNFQRGDRCMECYKLEKRINAYNNINNNVKNNNHTLLSKEYIDKDTEMEVQCNICGNIHKKLPRSLRDGNITCPVCEKIKEYTKVKESIEKENYKLLTPIEEYEKSTTKITIICDRGHIYTTTWNNFQSGHRCTKCIQSKGERKLEDILIKYNIKYETQYTYDDCKVINPLPFDFYLLDYNILIEYDGLQHYDYVDFANKGIDWVLDSFITCKVRDTIKNIYCQQNNIKLIRIPYWDFNNIENILIKELNL